jgi:hypothetical protein
VADDDPVPPRHPRGAGRRALRGGDLRLGQLPVAGRLPGPAPAAAGRGHVDTPAGRAWRGRLSGRHDNIAAPARARSPRAARRGPNEGRGRWLVRRACPSMEKHRPRSRDPRRPTCPARRPQAPIRPRPGGRAARPRTARCGRAAAS